MLAFTLSDPMAMGKSCMTRGMNQGLFTLSNRLKPLDIEIMKRLGSRVNLIPVIAKADTLTPNDLAQFKQRVGPKASF